MNPRRRRRLVRLFLPVLLGASCASAPEHLDRNDVGSLIAHGEYDEAARLAAGRHEANPGDAELERQWKVATIAVWLERGRRATFDDRDLDALQAFRMAEEIDPELPLIQQWIDQTLDKLARRWAETGSEWHAQENLERAVECYETALSHRPENKLAREGLARALLQQNYRDGMSQTYYADGMHALDEYWLEEAAHDFSASLKYQEEHDRAARRKSQTSALRADDRAAIGLALEGERRWAAARNEYRIALLIDPEHAEAQTGRDRMKKEEHAAQLLRDARRYMLRREFERAEKALGECAALTEQQADDVEAARQELLLARRWQKYNAARALENDSRFEDAVAAYDALLAETGGFEDAFARKETLEDFVSKAERHYAEALATEDPAAQLAALRQVMIVYPEYKDVRARVEALEATLGPEQAEEPR